jgi:hypothetical protein
MNYKRLYPKKFRCLMLALPLGIGLLLVVGVNVVLANSDEYRVAYKASLPHASQLILDPSANFTVNTDSDTHDANIGNGVCADSNGDCSLRAALEESNVLVGDDSILLPTGTYDLTNGQLNITDGLAIFGSEVSHPIINAQDNSRVFFIDKPRGNALINVVFDNLIIQNGRTAENGGGIWNNETLTISDSSLISNAAVTNGGGIYNTGGVLTITASVIGYNVVTSTEKGGGGVYNTNGYVTISGTLIITNTCSGNAPSGGGIFNEGDFLLINSIVSGNMATTTTDMAGVHGGGIYNGLLGKLEVVDSTLSGNSALAKGFTGVGSGGGVANGGHISISESRIRGNVANGWGGGIDNGGIMFIVETSISGNVSTGSGGGISNSGIGSNISIERSAIHDNFAFDSGGILHYYGMITLTNSTVSNNIANQSDGLSVHMNAVLSLTNSTIGANNDQSINSSGIVNTKNSIFEGAIYCINSGTLNSFGYNLIHSTNCSFTPVANDITGRDPLLASLANNGGKTLTRALLEGSPAIDQINPFYCPPTDQRGKARHGLCDIGAYENEYEFSHLTLSSSPNPSYYGQPVSFTTIVTSTDGIPTGDIIFYDNGGLLGTRTLNPNGETVLSTTVLPVGIHVITATYLGDSNFASNTKLLSPNQQVNKAKTFTKIISSSNPASYGEVVTFTALVTSTIGIPTGSVNFYDDGVPLGTTMLNTNGIAQFDATTLVAGTHTITVTYVGDNNFAVSTDILLPGQKILFKICLPLVIR